MSHPRSLLAIALVLLVAVSLAACGGSDSNDDPGGDDAKTEEPAPEEEDEDPAAEADDASAIEFVPGSGITGVSVGDTREKVVAALGEPTSSTDVRNELSGGTNERLDYDDPRMQVLVQEYDGGTEVIQVEVTDPTVTTATGDISIGSTQAELLEAFPDASCDTGALHLCRLGTDNAGDVVTDFFVQDGEVSRMVVGRVID